MALGVEIVYKQQKYINITLELDPVMCTCSKCKKHC